MRFLALLALLPSLAFGQVIQGGAPASVDSAGNVLVPTPTGSGLTLNSGGTTGLLDVYNNRIRSTIGFQAGLTTSVPKIYMSGNNGFVDHQGGDLQLQVTSSAEAVKLRAANYDILTVRTPDGSQQYFVTFKPTVTATFQTCTATYHGTILIVAVPSSAARSKVCLCSSDNAASPTYAWMNVQTSTVGTTTTCP